MLISHETSFKNGDSRNLRGGGTERVKSLKRAFSLEASSKNVVETVLVVDVKVLVVVLALVVVGVVLLMVVLFILMLLC